MNSISAYLLGILQKNIDTPDTASRARGGVGKLVLHLEPGHIIEGRVEGVSGGITGIETGQGLVRAKGEIDVPRGALVRLKVLDAGNPARVKLESWSMPPQGPVSRLKGLVALSKANLSRMNNLGRVLANKMDALQEPLVNIGENRQRASFRQLLCLFETGKEVKAEQIAQMSMVPARVALKLIRAVILAEGEVTDGAVGEVFEDRQSTGMDGVRTGVLESGVASDPAVRGSTDQGGGVKKVSSVTGVSTGRTTILERGPSHSLLSPGKSASKVLGEGEGDAPVGPRTGHGAENHAVATKEAPDGTPGQGVTRAAPETGSLSTSAKGSSVSQPPPSLNAKEEAGNGIEPVSKRDLSINAIANTDTRIIKNAVSGTEGLNRAGSGLVRKGMKGQAENVFERQLLAMGTGKDGRDPISAPSIRSGSQMAQDNEEQKGRAAQEKLPAEASHGEGRYAGRKNVTGRNGRGLERTGNARSLPEGGEGISHQSFVRHDRNEPLHTFLKAFSDQIDISQHLQAHLVQKGMNLLIVPFFLSHFQGVGQWMFWKEKQASRKQEEGELSHLVFDLSLRHLGELNIHLIKRRETLSIFISAEEENVEAVRQGFFDLAQTLKGAGFNIKDMEVAPRGEDVADAISGVVPGEEFSALHVVT